jgi:hypothetical protein
VEELIAQERERSHLYGGRSVFGWAQPSAAEPKVEVTEQPQRDVRRNIRAVAAGQHDVAEVDRLLSGRRDVHDTRWRAVLDKRQ